MSTKRIERSTQPTPERGITARARSIGVKRAADSTSRQNVWNDQMEAILNGSGMAGTILPTPYDVVQLFELIARSSMLPQCIDAMVTNTIEAGWEIVPIARGVEMDPDEVAELQSFIYRANADQSLATVGSLTDRDRYSVGFGFIEVIRDAKGIPSLLRNCPALTTRLTARDQRDQLIKYDVPRGKRTVVVKEYKKFRRYVQLVAGVPIFFREFGDPRRMNSKTGVFEGDPGFDPALELATEIIHLRNPSNDAYGKPQWISQLPSIIGSREAEEVNMRFFEDNTIPPAMITVAGGRLTRGSYEEIKRVIGTGVGKERQNKMILIEAVGDSDTMDGKGNAITIKVDKLTSERPSDGLFKEYKEGNQADLRSSFRLPPVSVGMSQDANFACYDEQTETLTDHGWVTIDQWQDGMKIACYDVDTGLIEFHAPNSGLLAYDVENVSMYHIQTEQQDILVTPNHRMLFSSDKIERWGVQPIEVMANRGRVYFKTSAQYEGGISLDTFDVPPSDYHGGIAARDADVGTMPINLLLEWLGYYIADGCIHSQHGVRIGARKARKIARFSAIHEELADCGFRVRHAGEPAGEYYTVSHKGFAAWLVTNAGQGSSNKRIPSLVWALPVEQLHILFDALMFCDGTWDVRDGRTSGNYSTVSKALADDVQRLAFLLGYRAAIRQDRPGSFGSLPIYRVLLSEKTTCQAYTDRHLTRVPYTGRVYCFSVPTGVFVTRRNGKIAIQGNTANVSQFVAETQVFAPARARDDEVLNNLFVNGRNGLRMKTIKLASRTPSISSPEMIMKALTALNVIGAVTPRSAQTIANSMLQIELPAFPAKGEDGWEEWMDQPMPLSIRPTPGSDAPQNTHAEQASKDAATKGTESDGNVAPSVPEHGSE